MKTAISVLFSIISLAFSSSLGFSQEVSPIPIETSMQMPYFSPEHNGQATLLIAVDRHGDVATINTLSTTNKDLLTTCKKAIVKWKFEPGRTAGKTTLGMYEHTFYIRSGKVVTQDEAAPKNEIKETELVAKIAEKPPQQSPPKPKVIKREMPELDHSLGNINGFVKINFGVTPQGKVDNASIINYSHQELIAPTLTAAKNWRFDEAPADAKAMIRSYQITLTLNGAKPRARSNWLIIDSVDVEAEPVRTQLPTIDVSNFSDGERFSATLTIDEYGYVAEVSPISNTNEPQAKAISQAFYAWKFKSAIKNGASVMSQNINQFIMKDNSLQVVRNLIDKQPRIIESKLPIQRANHEHLEGYVLVSMAIDKKGNVYDANVVESTNEKLNKPTIDASLKWKFLPGMDKNVAVESTMVVPFVYPVNG